MKKLFLPAMLLLFANSSVWAQGSIKPRPNQSPLEVEFARLSADFNKANEAYYAPYRKAKTEEESAKIKLDPAKAPDKLFLPKFKALAKKAGKNQVAAQAWMQVFGLSANDPKSQDSAFEKLVTDFPNAPVMSQLVSTVQYSFWDLGDKRDPKIFDCLNRIDRATTTPDVKANVLYTKAKMTAKDGKGDIKAAEAMFQKLIATYPDSKYAKNAKADIFEALHLSVGKVAPDFEATDENGVKFKLSDYRGKVVVLDFWGFW